MYLDYGSSDRITMSIITDGAASNKARQWNVRATFIECNSILRGSYFQYISLCKLFYKKPSQVSPCMTYMCTYFPSSTRRLPPILHHSNWPSKNVRISNGKPFSRPGLHSLCSFRGWIWFHCGRLTTI